MASNSIRVLDLTARVGELAIEQVGSALSGHPGQGPGHYSVSLSGTGSGPAFDWIRPAIGGTTAPDDIAPRALILVLGPGSQATARAALTQAWAQEVDYVRVLILPSAIVEEMTLMPLVKERQSTTTHVYRLPDSSPETLWFVLLEEFNKIVAQFAIDFSTKDGIPSMNNLNDSIQAAMAIDGAMAAALVDYRSGMCLAQQGTALNLDLAAAGNTQVVRAKLKTMESLGLRKGIEDILITLGDQYHLIRLVPNNDGLFLYLVLDKAKGNLALARYKLTDIERGLKV